MKEQTDSFHGPFLPESSVRADHGHPMIQGQCNVNVKLRFSKSTFHAKIEQIIHLSYTTMRLQLHTIFAIIQYAIYICRRHVTLTLFSHCFSINIVKNFGQMLYSWHF